MTPKMCECEIIGPCENDEWASEHEIVYCPLHALASEMLAFLIEMKESGGSPPTPLGWEQCKNLISRAAGKGASNAI